MSFCALTQYWITGGRGIRANVAPASKAFRKHIFSARHKTESRATSPEPGTVLCIGRLVKPSAIFCTQFLYQLGPRITPQPNLLTSTPGLGATMSLPH